MKTPLRSWIETTLKVGMLFLFAGCAKMPQSEFKPLLDTQPYVISISPSSKQKLKSLDQIEIEFSYPLEASSIHEHSIFLAEGELQAEKYSEAEILFKEVEQKTVRLVGGKLTSQNDFKKVLLQPQTSLQASTYTLVITPELKGENQVPFSAEPGAGAKPFFVVFHLEGSKGSSASEQKPSSPKVRPHSLVIQEFLYDPAGEETNGYAFLELYGTPETDISGYQVTLVNGSDGKILKIITLPEGSKIRKEGVFLIADSKNGYANQSNVANPDFIDNFDPQNGPDAVQLLNEQGELVDALAYGSGGVGLASNQLPCLEGVPALDAKEGHSLSRVQGKDTNDNSADFVELEQPTPGEL